MIRQEIDELIHRHPFEPFSIHLTSDDRFDVWDSGQVAQLKSGIFIAQRNSDKRVIIPFLHISAVQTVNGHSKSNGRRGRRSN
jgi:hypothetical protein